MHIKPLEGRGSVGGHRELMSDWPRFVEGETYTYERIARYSFPVRGHRAGAPPDALFVYSRDPETDLGVFDEVVEPVDPLISSQEAHQHVEAMGEKGTTFRQIARLARHQHRVRSAAGSRVKEIGCSAPPGALPLREAARST